MQTILQTNSYFLQSAYFFTDALARDGPSSVPDTLEMLWICFYRRLIFYICFRNAACEVQEIFTNATRVRYFYKLMRFAPTKLLISKKKFVKTYFYKLCCFLSIFIVFFLQTLREFVKFLHTSSRASTDTRPTMLQGVMS